MAIWKRKNFPANYQVKGKETLSVVKGKEKNVKVQSKKAIELLVENGEKDNYKMNLVIDKNKLNEDGELTAPIKKGDKLVTSLLRLKMAKIMGILTEILAKAITSCSCSESVEKANWFVLSMRAIGGFFGDVWSRSCFYCKRLVLKVPCIKRLRIVKNYSTLWKKTILFL